MTGLARVPRGIDGDGQPDGGGSVEFEQYQRHTVWDRPGGLANRSGAGDLDVVIYSARKWCRLALAGNPTVLLALFVPDEEVVHRDALGAELVANAHRFVSRLAGDRFVGYLRSQRQAMTGEIGAHTNRPELVAVHGYDTKFAMHALRLGVQGTELLSTGRITLPIPEPELSFLRAVRRGEVGLRRGGCRGRPRRGASAGPVRARSRPGRAGPGLGRRLASREPPRLLAAPRPVARPDDTPPPRLVGAHQPAEWVSAHQPAEWVSAHQPAE